MQIKTLENITVDELMFTFNEAFKNYFVKISLSKEILENKIISEEIDLKLSAGAFIENRLVGFILHGIRTIDGIKTAYNAGTGVIEEARGKKLTAQMYQFIQKKLKEAKVQRCILEVISENTPAIKSYKNAGFSIIKDLECYEGLPNKTEIPEIVSFSKIHQKERLAFQNNWDWQPTWQHANETIDKSSSYLSLGMFGQDKMLGYCTFNPQTGRVVQYCIEKQERRNNYGHMLFSKVAETVNGKLSVINVDGDANPTLLFLEKISMTKSLKQYLMELTLNESEY